MLRCVNLIKFNSLSSNSLFCLQFNYARWSAHNVSNVCWLFTRLSNRKIVHFYWNAFVLLTMKTAWLNSIRFGRKIKRIRITWNCLHLMRPTAKCEQWMCKNNGKNICLSKPLKSTTRVVSRHIIDLHEPIYPAIDTFVVTVICFVFFLAAAQKQ